MVFFADLRMDSRRSSQSSSSGESNRQVDLMFMDLEPFVCHYFHVGIQRGGGGGGTEKSQKYRVI